MPFFILNILFDTISAGWSLDDLWTQWLCADTMTSQMITWSGSISGKFEQWPQWLFMYTN